LDASGCAVGAIKSSFASGATSFSESAADAVV
jgi:hypothetical protein